MQTKKLRNNSLVGRSAETGRFLDALSELTSEKLIERVKKDLDMIRSNPLPGRRKKTKKI